MRENPARSLGLALYRQAATGTSTSGAADCGSMFLIPGIWPVLELLWGGSGVDIKAIRYDVEIKAIAQRFFSVSEQRDLASLPVDDQHRAFFNCWTRKEAYVKALESGLLLSLSEFDVSLGALNRPAFWPRVRIRTRRSVGRCSERALGEKDAAAIAAEGAGMKVTCHELISGFGSGDADANS